MGALISLGKADVQKGRLSLGLHGPGWADLTIATDNVPAEGSQQRLVVDGGLEWVGTVRRAGAYLLTTEVRLVGGAGGLGREVVGAYRNAQLGDVLAEIMSTSGETQSSSIAQDVLEVPLERWTLGRTTASRALAELAAAASQHLDGTIGWRVLADGTTWIGAETWPAQAMPDDAVISKLHPDEGRAVIGCAAPSLLPGIALDGFGRVAGVDHYVDPERIRAEVWSAEQLDPIEKLAQAVLSRLGLAYLGAPQLERLQLARARVDAVASDGSTVDVTPESGRLSPMQGVPMRQGPARAKVKTGARVQLAWEGGSSAGVVALPIFDDGATYSEVTVTADLVNLAGTGGKRVLTADDLAAVKAAISGAAVTPNDGGAALKANILAAWPASPGSSKVKAAV